MAEIFHRDYLTRLPLPLAQLYRRAHNAKDARSRHDYAFYFFEAFVKLTAAPLIAAYVAEVRQGRGRVRELDQQLAQLALPSLGQWVGMLRELSRHYGSRADAATHPLGHLWEQLNGARKDRPAILALFRQIRNGADGKPAGDQSCSLLQLFDALVQYRNGVFGHGAARFAAFYESEMGPLLFPAADELVAEGMIDPLGPRGTRLVYIGDIRTLSPDAVEVAIRELVGTESERAAPLQLKPAETAGLVPNVPAVLWPGYRVPLRLDPLLRHRESETSEEVLFLNRARNGKQVEYLSYVTGATQRDAATAADLAALLTLVTGREVDEAQLNKLSEMSLSETPSFELLLGVEQTPKSTILGDYEVLAELGHGGMGVVYLARQLSLGRLVAVKMLPADLAADEVALTRFQREIRALARCDHPNIVKVLASGRMPDGQFYYAMEYVPGCDLEQVWRELRDPSDAKKRTSAMDTDGHTVARLGGTTFARAVLSAASKQRRETQGRHARARSASSAGQTPVDVSPIPLPPLPQLPSAEGDPGGYVRRVVEIVRDAALALQAAHEQQVVHRDVKPANLMLTPDGSRVVLMDFGLAKGQEASLTASRQGGLLGTMRYAAPEQLASASLKIGPAADVRGLGATLWELLTRRRLFADAADERQLATMVHDTDVPRLREIDGDFDRDLDAIVARATERRVADRISSAGKFAEYLQLYLDHKPLPIRPPGAAELAQRWVSEHRGLVASVLAGSAVIFVAVVWAFLAIATAKNHADAARKIAVESNHQLEQQLYITHIAVAERELTSNHDFDRATKLLDECPEKLRGWEWRYLMRRRDAEPLSLQGHTSGLWMADVSADGRKIVTAAIDGRIKIWDARSGAMLHDIDAQPEPLLPVTLPEGLLSSLQAGLGIPRIPIMCVAFSPDGRQIASGSFALKVSAGLMAGVKVDVRNSPGVVTIWDAETGKKINQFSEQLGIVLSLGYSADGKYIASSSINAENTFVIWDARTMKVVQVMRGHDSQVHRIRFSRDGRMIASSDTSGNLKLWDATTFQAIHSIPAHPAAVIDLAFAPDGRRVATASLDGTVRIWDTTTFEKVGDVRGHMGSALAVMYSPDGKLIASGGFDKTVRIWDADTFEERITLRGHLDTVWSVTFSPNGQKLVSSSFDKSARIWDATPREESRGTGIFQLAGHTERTNTVAYSANGRYLASGSWDKDVRVWDAKTGAPIRTLSGHSACVYGIAISPDSTLLASASWDRTVKVWDIATGSVLHTLQGHTAPIDAVAFSPDGRRLASCGYDGLVKVWDVQSGALITTCEGFIFPLFSVSFSPDGERLASCGSDRSVKLWNSRTGANLLTLRGHGAVVNGVAFSPDGQRLVSGSWDKTIKIWDVSARPLASADRLLLTLTGHDDRVNSVAFSRDGTRIASGSEDKTARLWDPKTGIEVLPPLHHRGAVWSVAFNPDGNRLATASWTSSGWVRTWDIEAPRAAP